MDMAKQSRQHLRFSFDRSPPGGNFCPLSKEKVRTALTSGSGSRGAERAQRKRARSPAGWVAEVKFLAWTEDNLLRQVVYEGLRQDKPAAGVRREMPLTKSTGTT